MSTSKIPPDSASADYLLTRGVKLETAEAEDGRCRPSDKPDYGEVLYFPLHGGEGYLGKYLPAIPGKKDKGFRAPKYSKQPIFIPKATWEAKGDSTPELFITEGPVKALALLQAGFLSIGLIGTWISERDGWYRPLMRVLRQFEWRNRDVFLGLDADQDGKTHIRQSAIRDSLLLTPLGAHVYRLKWPFSQGKGIDDYLVGKDAIEELDRLLEEARGNDLFSEYSTDADLLLVKKELHRTIRDEAWFSRLTKQFAKKFGVTVRSLGRFQPSKREEKTSKSEGHNTDTGKS